MDDLPIARVKDFELGLIEYLAKSHPGIGEKLRQTKKFETETEAQLKSAIAAYKTQFTAKKG